MKTIESQLEHASTEVRQKASQIADRNPVLVRQTLRRRRTAGTTSVALLALAVLTLPVWLVVEPVRLSTLASGGEVSFEEYEAAYTDYVGCLRDAGYTLDGPLLFGRDADAFLALGVGENPTIQLQWRLIGEVDQRAFDFADHDCRKTHVAAIEDRWVEQEAAKLLGEREWIDNVLACAASSGVEVPAGLSFDEMLNGVGTDPSDDMILDLAAKLITDYGCRPWEE